MGFWFGRKSAPEPVRAFVPAWLGAGGSEGFARGYEAQFDEVYRNNPVGQRAVRLVSGMLGSLSVYSAEGDEAAARLIGSELLEGIGAAMLLHGNAFVQLLTDADEKPAELVMLRPERIKVETDSNGWPVAYTYRAGGKTVRLARADGLGRTLIAHVRSLHPRDDHYGMGCLDAAIAAAHPVAAGDQDQCHTKNAACEIVRALRDIRSRRLGSRRSPRVAPYCGRHAGHRSAGASDRRSSRRYIDRCGGPLCNL